MEGAETSSMWPDKERMCKSPRDSDWSGVTKKNALSVCGVPCDSRRNSACDSVLCTVSGRCAAISDEVLDCCGLHARLQPGSHQTCLSSLNTPLITVISAGEIVPFHKLVFAEHFLYLHSNDELYVRSRGDDISTIFFSARLFSCEENRNIT